MQRFVGQTEKSTFSSSRQKLNKGDFDRAANGSAPSK